MFKKKYIQSTLAACLCVLLLAGCGKKGAAENSRGLSFYEKGSYEEAAEAFENAVDQDDSSVEYRLNLAMAQLAQGDYEKAMENASLAGEMEPDSAAAFRVKGIICFEQENYADAISYFDSSLSLLGDEGDEKMTRDVLLYKADAELKSGDYEGAASDYGELIAGNGKEPEYYILRGKARMAAGDSENAGSDFKKALELAPKNTSYYIDIYLAYEENGQGDAGMPYLESALSLAKGGDEKASVYYYTAMAQMQAGGYADALSNIQSGLSEAADESVIQELFYSEAVCYEYQGEFKTALDKFKAYRDAYGSDETLDHEIAFLESRIQEGGS